MAPFMLSEKLLIWYASPARAAASPEKKPSTSMFAPQPPPVRNPLPPKPDPEMLSGIGLAARKFVVLIVTSMSRLTLEMSKLTVRKDELRVAAQPVEQLGG